MCVDPTAGYVISNSETVATHELTPGLHLLTNGELNDGSDRRIALARSMFEAESFTSMGGFLDVAPRVCRQGRDAKSGASIVLHGPTYGPVSSTLIGLSSTERSRPVYYYAAGAPDEKPYEDYSPLLRQVLMAEEKLPGAKQ